MVRFEVIAALSFAALTAGLATPAHAQSQPLTPKSAQPAPPPPRANANKAWLGIGIEHGIYGVRVNEVIRQTPAQHCGLRVGDEIIAVDRSSVLSPNSLIARVSTHSPGSEVGLTVMRQGRRVRVTARLDMLPTEDEILRLRLLDRISPDFRLPLVDRFGAQGKTLRLSSLRGRVVVLVFWASWDRGSRATHIPLTKLMNKHGYRGLEVIAVSSESTKGLKKFLAKNSVPFKVVRDPVGHTRSRLFRAPSLPAVVVIDRRGIIRHAGLGAGANMSHAAFAVERALRGLYR